MEIKVLYEDNHLIAVYKPAGVLVMAGEGRPSDERLRSKGDEILRQQSNVGSTERRSANVHDDNTLYWQVKEFLKKRDKKPGNVFLGVLHRLDRPVSGIILFAKTSKGAARLSEQIREREVTKIYTALVMGELKIESGTLEHNLLKDEKAKKAIVGAVGDVAILHYNTIKSNRHYSLLNIELETGRYHQIRVQLSAMGHPIVGDTKYGAPEALLDKSIMLCAIKLSFTTATTGKEIKLSIPVPDEFSRRIRQHSL